VVFHPRTCGYRRDVDAIAAVVDYQQPWRERVNVLLVVVVREDVRLLPLYQRVLLPLWRATSDNDP
jgi:hypothetical protein